MHTVLIVANQTAGGKHLSDLVRKKMARGECRFTLLVPASAPNESFWTDQEAEALAHRRLEQALKKLGEFKVDVKGVVGDGNVILAINDLMLRESFDEIVLSTLPPGISRWIKQDLPHRVSRRFAIPVTHVIGHRDLIRA